MPTSQILLTEFIQAGSEAAFRELVARYIDLVYTTALRLVDGDTHRAEDVAQTVFIDLARSARSLSSDVMLGGWLHRHTCFVASKTMRGERRRESREREAVEMNALHENTGPDFGMIKPILDEAINELGDEDRTAVLLRFFEQHSFRSVGEALGSSEDAARMRVTRALEKLEGVLKRHGVTTSAATLAAVLSANAVQGAPVGLAGVVSTAAALAGAMMVGGVATVSTKGIAFATLQKAVLGMALAVAVGAAFHESRRAGALRAELEELKQQIPMDGQIGRLQEQRDVAARRLAPLGDDNKRLSDNSAELFRLRGEVTRLRAQSRENSPSNGGGTGTVGKAPIVAGIIVKNIGPWTISTEKILAIIRSREGAPYLAAVVDDDVRALYAIGYFRNVRVNDEAKLEGVVLTYVLEERPNLAADSLANVGLGTPENGFQTFMWAAMKGDSNRVSQILRWRKDERVTEEMANLIVGAQTGSALKTFAALAGIRILQQRWESPVVARMRVEFAEENGRTNLGEIYMLREAGEWKPAINISSRPGSTSISASFLLPLSLDLGPVN